MSSDKESIRDILANLVEAADANDLAEVQSLTNKVLSSINDDKSYGSLKGHIQKTHCRSLIGLSKYEDASEFCDSLGQGERKNLVLERTYALYKLGRYAVCRDAIHKEQNESLSEDTVRGLAHILAQCHYRLQETEQSLQLYSDLAGASDFDEDTEIVANAMAAATANNSVPIEFPAIKELHDTITKELENINSEADYPYEMVYNYATHLLQTSTSLSQTKQALELLSSAEEECKASFENGESEDEIMMLKELLPIKTNSALGKMLSGDLNGSLRSNLEVILSSKKVLGKDPHFNGGGGMFAAEHNLVVLNQQRGTAPSPYDLLKKMPDMSSGMGSNGGKPIINPNQVRIMLYNRAVLYHQMGKVAEMKSTLNSLRSSLSPNAQARRQVENGKKNKQKSASSSGKYFAAPASNSEKLLWECRIAILENDSSAADAWENIENGLGDEQSHTDVLEYAIAEFKLHNAQKDIESKEKIDSRDRMALASTLEDLPGSIRDRPATVASLCSLYRSLEMHDKAESTLNASLDSGMAQKNLADFKLRLGMYAEAAEIYESLLSSGSDLSPEEAMDCNAGLVKALTHIDIEKAMDLAETVELDSSDGEIDGEELEATDLPRLSKGSIGGIRGSKIIGRENGG